ncbi:hypothetical protein L596_004515 [Steinernema carpocapsae]|uniref:G-protein coupled receptors family 1 profile domain-containing protein n=1 Tax=Steinernema carpocapsae TaxID=34508 RepID=A0A4U8UXN1_STECR|nr:hypothetical protein L596_004515 [Steinernema carpocapsae]
MALEMSRQPDAFSENTVSVWLTVSQFLYWFVLVIGFITLPLLFRSLVSILKYSSNQYFPFLAAIIVGDFLMLFTISMTLVLERFAIDIQGDVMCKLTAFTTNASACFVHWVWVGMFVQRFTYIFYPLRSRRNVVATRKSIGSWMWCLMDDSSKLIAITAIWAIVTQSWTPLLIAENRVSTNTQDGVFCGPDTTIVDPTIFKVIVLIESAFTYAIPFFITLFSDIAVLFWRNSVCVNPPQFTLITLESLGTSRSLMGPNTDGTAPLAESQYLKIQSDRSIQKYQSRRHRAICRCLLMTSINLLLNLPTFVLQILDEFLVLRLSVENSVFYIYADAISYVLYLLQFPLVSVYIHYLRYDMEVYKRDSKTYRSDEQTTMNSHKRNGTPPSTEVNSSLAESRRL